ncbi:CoA-transferase subunit beta [Zavarzinia compransoris]|uniref:Ketoacid CoA transferase n=1 Tax=Zavarzinia compransoris TaxID=1264899 RepID=A0A317DT58_9PROT|nr:ketoacid CoA transferase [Zavarzinia compransoris]PWR17554.1 ketoacid CoA transferase [Zavarzinia compransoris]TDP49211.1 glutaconate CoA-transferase subunit B [Zavarzinia compransoris]
MTYTLAELCIAAAAEAWRGNGEVLASGIGLVPRLAASLAKASFAPELMMTDGEAYLVEAPVPVGKRGAYVPQVEGCMTYARVFDVVYRGHRHAMTGPVQVDRFGQQNISAVGDYRRPKAALLGVRGIPGNTINHINSMFVPNHSTRVFVSGEVDMVSGVGYNPARLGGGRSDRFVDLRLIVTDLAVLDFGGADHAIRVRHLHPGIGFDQVQAATGFPLEGRESATETPAPTAEQLHLIRNLLDPHDVRATVFKENPPGDRRRAA